MRIILEMDAGDILLQEEATILDEDTTESLSERLAAQGAALFTRAVGLVASGGAVFTPQDPARVVACRKLEKEDGLIRWERPATELHNLVRAAIPWPVAHTTLRGTPLRVHRTRVVAEEEMRLEALCASPGTVLFADKEGIVVSTGECALALLSVQAPGKRIMTADEYLRGNPVKPGERMGEP
jgi:methionyl-tRNA formyltransferase